MKSLWLAELRPWRWSFSPLSRSRSFSNHRNKPSRRDKYEMKFVVSRNPSLRCSLPATGCVKVSISCRYVYPPIGAKLLLQMATFLLSPLEKHCHVVQLYPSRVRNSMWRRSDSPRGKPGAPIGVSFQERAGTYECAFNSQKSSIARAVLLSEDHDANIPPRRRMVITN